MKKLDARFYRSNPQLRNGGYETVMTIEARTISSARKKAREIEDRCPYGSLSLIEIAEAETA